MASKIKETVIPIDVNGKGASLGSFYGIFFEDINHAADGGLYAQMLQNASFEFSEIDNRSYNSLTAWEIVGSADVVIRSKGGLFDKNPHYADIAAIEPGKNGIRNLGYGKKGLYLKKGGEYRLSFFAKGAIPISIALEAKTGEELASASLVLTDDWTRYTLTLTPSEETEEGRLAFYLCESGRIALDALSLFPADTYKNGIYRKDLAEALEELTPRFMRFPGGCLVHDGALDPDKRDACYCWKNSVGAPEARPSKRNNWGYNQSLGLGYYEYFVLCEHLKCEPLPVIPAGWNPHRQEACPLDKMQPWIDDALDLIEFANGDETTVWGKVRSELGHPKPFRMKYLAIGNEEVGAQFTERYGIIAAAVKEKYSKIKLIHSAGPFASGSEYDRGYEGAKRDGADLIDEHYYCSPDWLLANVHRYDKFPARKPKVFLGEYASCGGKYYNAVVEAAYMTGLENAAHAVSLTCYAPLLCNADYVNWTPDLIWFDNKRVCKTPSYYVQKLFANNLGDCLLPVDRSGIGITHADVLPISGLAEICSDGAEGWLWDVKVVNLGNGDEVDFGSFDVDAKFKTTLSEINLTDYELRFSFKKGGGRDDKGIYINFGKTGDKDCLCWQFGGWQNQDSLVASRKNGLNAVLDQHIFRVEAGVEYELCLRVEGRKITTLVNGKTVNVCEDKLPDIEDVYVSASKLKKSGEVIIKAVNVLGKAHNAVFELDGADYEGTAYSLSGYVPDAVNTLEAELVVPKEASVKAVGGKLKATLPPLSVTVFRIKKK